MRLVKAYTTRKSTRRDRQRDEREAPVQVQHHPDDPDQRQDVGHDAEERRGDEVLDAFDVVGDAADEIAGSLLVVLGQRQAMDVVIQRPPQVVHHPLPDGRGQTSVFRYELTAPADGDDGHRDDGDS